MLPRRIDEIRLHLGAHRTGTTGLQNLLQSHSEAASRCGVSVLTPDRYVDVRRVALPRALLAFINQKEAEEGLRPLLSAPRRVARRLRAAFAIRTMLDDDDRVVVLSEENILGRLSAPLSRLGFYGDAASRLDRLRAVMGRRRLSRIFLGIRAYDEFYESVYARAIVRHATPPLEAVRKRALGETRGWANLVADIRLIFPEAAVTVWRHEAHDATARLRDLLGRDLPGGLRSSGDRNHASPSAAAVAELRRRRDEGGLREAEAEAIVRRLSGGERFRAFPEEEREALRARYRRDLAALAEMERVELAAR